MEETASPYRWENDKIRLRPTHPSDWIYFFEDYSNSEARFLFYTEAEGPLDKQSASARFKRFLKTAEKKGRMDLTIEDKSGEAVGSLNLYDVDKRNGTFQIAVMVRAAARGHGYARAALLMLLKYAFLELRLHKYNVRIVEGNTASVRLHESIGCRPEGVIRDMYFHEGKYLNMLYYGLTAEEFSCLNY